MKRTLLTLTLFAILSAGFAQNGRPKTLIGNDPEDISGFGAVLFSMTPIDGSLSTLTGGGGAVLFDNSFFSSDSLKNWKVDKVVTMRRMFESTSFNGDLSDWNTSSVDDMSFMFHDAAFNNDSIEKWNVENVKTFESMFDENEEFNQDLSQWQVSSVENFQEMFVDATAFNQQLCWDISSATDNFAMFQGSGGGGLLECCSTYKTDNDGDYRVDQLNLIDSESPSVSPSCLPSESPSVSPSAVPSASPSTSPTKAPSKKSKKND